MKYVCEHCGEQFTSEILCKEHEFNHVKEKDLLFFDERHNSLKITTENLNDAFYIYAGTVDAIDYVNLLFRKTNLQEYLENGVGLYEWNGDIDYWVNITKEAERLNAIIAQLKQNWF